MKRFYKFATSLVVITAIGFTASAYMTVQAAPNASQNVYSVRGGETLWSIVNHHHQYDGQDRNEVVFRIKQLNGLTSSEVEPGQLIKLP